MHELELSHVFHTPSDFDWNGKIAVNKMPSNLCTCVKFAPFGLFWILFKSEQNGIQVKRAKIQAKTGDITCVRA